MKVRKGFVSNSSSSSFVCDISGSTEGGWDASLRDVGMIRCENGHEFITYGYPEVEEFVNGTAELTEEEEDNDERERDELPARLCPICNGKAKPAIIERLKGEMNRLGIDIKDLK